MTDKPKDMAVLLRQISSCKGKGVSEYPEWFQEQFKKDSNYFSDIIGEAADEMERLQKMAGKLHRIVYPD